MAEKYKKGIVFGVFDVFHKGHEYFLMEAKGRCEELVVVVTLDEVVGQMKRRPAEDVLEKRIANINAFGFAAVPGDSVMGSWQVLKDHAPDIVLLGYDQEGIRKELDRLGMPHASIGSHRPDIYKSSLLRKRI